MTTTEGKLVAGLIVVRLARCQYGSAKGEQRCTNKTRIALGFPLLDMPGLTGARICGPHIETMVENMRKVLK